MKFINRAGIQETGKRLGATLDQDTAQAMRGQSGNDGARVDPPGSIARQTDLPDTRRRLDTSVLCGPYGRVAIVARHLAASRAPP